MMYPLSQSDEFTVCVAEEIRSCLEPFIDFGMQVNVAVFWVDNKSNLHALAHLDRLPIMNRTLLQCGMSVEDTARAFLNSDKDKLDMLLQMIGADPQDLYNQLRSSQSPVLHAVE